MTMQQYCLRWNNHQPNFISVFSNLLSNESLVDVTLAAEGRHLQAHRVVLSACSSYFQSLFTINPCQHPIVILKDVKFADLKVMIDFMYYGEVNVSQEQLPHILKTAEMLKIKGLAEIPVDQSVSKTQSCSADKAELLTPGDSNWSSDGAPQQSLSPSPCPLSPNSKRKRLRKTSTESGSGSTERTLDDHQSSEVTLSSSVGSVPGTVIKSDPGYTSDGNSILQKSKQHSSDSELQRGSSHESVEGEIPHHVTLQIPTDVNVQPNMEGTGSMEVSHPSVSTSQLTLSGMQWNMVDQATYAQFAPFSPPTTNVPPAPVFTQCTSNTAPQIVTPTSLNQCYPNQINNSPPQILQKRKRSTNPQGDENFIKALEAVRFGGIGFCKAARMYGVNNRTLWLEYKKRGYPNFRLSIKNRKQENTSANLGDSTQPIPSSPSEPMDNKREIEEAHPVALISTTYFDGKQVDLGTMLQRPKYLDTAVINTQQNQASTTHAQLSQRTQQAVMGTKRGRFLMRQPRIKRESDPSQLYDNEPLSPQYLSVPPIRVERQCSEPLPALSPPPGKLLTVPGSMLVKQHSHPLLPSQTHQPLSPPLHIQLMQHSHSADAAERAVSPIVVVTDPLSVLPHEVPLRADSASIAPGTTLKIKTEELRRSSSSPQTSGRSSHCPVVRPGPALGCNFCWNTVDDHGRILRRKTKYHCPECQTNLCIVPCFQEYHEKHVVPSPQTDPLTLTTSVMRIFPKTTSM